jgi:hypothetical protein
MKLNDNELKKIIEFVNRPDPYGQILDFLNQLPSAKEVQIFTEQKLSTELEIPVEQEVDKESK